MGGLEAIDPRYGPLFERATTVLGDDHRVRSVSIGGSVAAGNADRWSDLDLTVVTDPDYHDDFVADWPIWLGRITPTVFARTPIAPFIINAVNTNGLTLDLAIWSGQAPVFTPPAVEYSVGMLSSTRFTNVSDALEYAVAEQLRGLGGPFITLIQRDEHLKHLTGLPHVLGLLTTVFLAETGEVPPGKLWNATYTEDQRATVASLPAVRATRDDLIAFSLALAELMLTRARPLFDRYGLDWPSELAQVTSTRLRDELGVDTSDWLN